MKIIRWFREAYRGALWPTMCWLGAIGYGAGEETHSGWHVLAWPSFAVGFVGLSQAIGRIKAKSSKPKP